MLYTTLDNFYLSDQELNQSPSRLDGIDGDLESTLRVYGCELIQEACVLLDLPQAAAATGQVLLQRFYCKKSFREFSVKRMATACTWVASKLEECPVTHKEVLAVFHRMIQRREGKPLIPLDPHSKVFQDKKAWLTMYERRMLRAFGFIMHVDHPHKFLISVLHQVTLRECEEHKQSELMQEAWSLVNDSLRTTLCVRFKSETVACGIIFMAARRLKVPLCEDPPWWAIFNVKKADMFEVCRVLTELYQRPKAVYVPVAKDDQPVSKPATPMAPSSPEMPDGSPGLSSLADDQTAMGPSPLDVGPAPATASAVANGALQDADEAVPTAGPSSQIVPTAADLDAANSKGRVEGGALDTTRDNDREKPGRDENERDLPAREGEPDRNRKDYDRDRDRERRDREDRGRERDRGKVRDKERKRDRDTESGRNKDRYEEVLPKSSRQKVSSSEERDGRQRTPERIRDRYSSRSDRERGRDRKRTPPAEYDRDRGYKRTPPVEKQNRSDKPYSDRLDRREERRGDGYGDRADRPGKKELDRQGKKDREQGSDRADKEQREERTARREKDPGADRPTVFRRDRDRGSDHGSLDALESDPGSHLPVDSSDRKDRTPVDGEPPENGVQVKKAQGTTEQREQEWDGDGERSEKDPVGNGTRPDQEEGEGKKECAREVNDGELAVGDRVDRRERPKARVNPY